MMLSSVFSFKQVKEASLSKGKACDWNLCDWQMLLQRLPTLENYSQDDDLCVVDAYLDEDMTIVLISPKLLSAWSRNFFLFSVAQEIARRNNRK